MSEINAPIAGSLLRVLVAPGDRVEAGTTVALIESMKLEIPVESPFAGTVARVAVQDGEIVQERDVIVILDDD